MTQDIADVQRIITSAFNFCDNCDRTFPSRQNICSVCGGRLRRIEQSVQASSVVQPTIPIEVILNNERVIDELQLHLWVVEEVQGENVRFRKYQRQAEELMHKIPISRPIPPFIINLSDLPESLVKQLEACSKRGLDYIIKSAVGRIFEAVNLDYYTISVARSLVVKIQK